MIRFLSEHKFPVDPLLPNSRLQAMKAILALAEKQQTEPRREPVEEAQTA